MFFFDHSKETPQRFSQRLEKAYETSSLTPDRQHGRFAWISGELAKRGATASPESVRKWFAGMTHPRGDTMGALAEVLGVSRDWLENGAPPDETPPSDEIPDPDFEIDDNEFLVDFETGEEIGSAEYREKTTAAWWVSARMMFAGIKHRLRKDRILMERGTKAIEIAVVVMSAVADQGGAWVARLPDMRSGFEPYTTSYDVLMLVMPRAGREPRVYVIRGRGAAKLGDEGDMIRFTENAEAELVIDLGPEKTVNVPPVRNFEVMSKI